MHIPKKVVKPYLALLCSLSACTDPSDPIKKQQVGVFITVVSPTNIQNETVPANTPIIHKARGYAMVDGKREDITTATAYMWYSEAWQQLSVGDSVTISYNTAGVKRGFLILKHSSGIADTANLNFQIAEDVIRAGLTLTCPTSEIFPNTDISKCLSFSDQNPKGFNLQATVKIDTLQSGSLPQYKVTRALVAQNTNLRDSVSIIVATRPYPTATLTYYPVLPNGLGSVARECVLVQGNRAPDTTAVIDSNNRLIVSGRVLTSDSVKYKTGACGIPTGTYWPTSVIVQKANIASAVHIQMHLKNWPVTAGCHTGKIVSFDPLLAIEGNRNDSWPYFRHNGNFSAAGWVDDSVLVAFDRSKSHTPITAEDSANFAADLQRTTACIPELGIFKMSQIEKLPPQHGVRVLIDTTIISGFGPSGPFPNLTTGSIILKNTSMMGHWANGIGHEAIHLLGLGHSCNYSAASTFFSLMVAGYSETNGSCGSPSASPPPFNASAWDAAYIAAWRRAYEVQRQYNTLPAFAPTMAAIKGN